MGRQRGDQGSLLADLRAVLAGRDFRRLFSTRLISQAGDGVFTAGLGTYVFFNAETFRVRRRERRRSRSCTCHTR